MPDAASDTDFTPTGAGRLHFIHKWQSYRTRDKWNMKCLRRRCIKCGKKQEFREPYGATDVGRWSSPLEDHEPTTPDVERGTGFDA